MTNRRQILSGALSLTVLSAMGTNAANAQSRFEISGDKFLLDGKPIQILAGEMHYPRIPRALWRDRMRKLKSLGLNTLATYVFWNLHEPKPGHYDFSDNLDVAAYIQMAKEEGLLVTLRPGPYVCAEFDGGGFPAWLFPEPNIPARTTDTRFFTPVKTWLKRLGQELSPLLISRGGPIILTQVENEYGSFGKDRAYMEAARQALIDAGFDGMHYTADPASDLANGHLPDLMAGINFGTDDPAEKEFEKRKAVRSGDPLFCTELWDGWFDHFGETHSTKAAEPLVSSLDWMMKNNISISFYMLHGGTSWGFMAGANYDKKNGYRADISSYDYDAILDEAGRPTAKYKAVRELFGRYLPAERFAPLPEAERAVELPRFRLTQAASLNQLKGKAIKSEFPLSLETMGLNHGMALYRHSCKQDIAGQLSFDDVRDYAIVSASNTQLGTMDRRLRETKLPVTAKSGQSLDILVDTMGHVNYGEFIGKDQKGLIGKARLNSSLLKGWDNYGFPLDDISRLKFKNSPVKGPAFYRGTFTLKDSAYTFLDMRGWGKGYVWVNGHNLGRYWSAGPQCTVFVPAPWVHAGDNEIIVLDLIEGAERTLEGVKNPIWNRQG